MEVLHWKQMMDKEYLGSWDIAPGQDIIATIKSITQRELMDDKGRKSKRPVAYFVESNIKPMVLNSTNCTTITNLYKTDNPNLWIGKQIQIYATETNVGRQKVPCLRIRDYVGYKCCMCHKDIDINTYRGSVQKYGAPYCSKECLDKAQQQKNKSYL